MTSLAAAFAARDPGGVPARNTKRNHWKGGGLRTERGMSGLRQGGGAEGEGGPYGGVSTMAATKANCCEQSLTMVQGSTMTNSSACEAQGNRAGEGQCCSRAGGAGEKQRATGHCQGGKRSSKGVQWGLTLSRGVNVAPRPGSSSSRSE